MVEIPSNPRDYGGGGRIVNNDEQPDTWATVATFEMVPPSTLGAGLPPDYYDMVQTLARGWLKKLRRNCLRARYYDGKNKLKDFGISTPPQLLNVETVVGWAQKAVDALAVRSRFDGFSAGYDETQILLDDIVERSRLPIKYRQAVQGELIHSCCFAAVKMTDDGHARIDVYDAEHATAIWDDAAGRVAYGLVIDKIDQQVTGYAVDMTLLTDQYAIHLWYDGMTWQWEAEQHKMGVCPMVAFAYRPTLRRPFGVSRINRSVMSLIDSAVRVALGGDISFQFAVSPQKYLLNADKNPFEEKTKWEAYIGSIFAVGNDENDRTPVFGQLAQASMQQTTEYMRLLASRFAAETNIPLAQLGVAADSNPSSAEALYAASEPLIIEAEDLNDGARDSLKQVALMSIATELDISYFDIPDELKDFSVNMKNPAMPSIVSQADAMIKVASVVPTFAGTDTFFEQLGFTEDVRRRIRSETEKATGTAILNSIFGGGGNGANIAAIGD